MVVWLISAFSALLSPFIEKFFDGSIFAGEFTKILSLVTTRSPNLSTPQKI